MQQSRQGDPQQSRLQTQQKRLAAVQEQLGRQLNEIPELRDLLLEWFELRYALGQEERTWQSK
jgi:hypothetical protein